ncbi:hypothetical protein MX059_08635 [Streptococcus uberis]|nr:hypothetical protein [Streptococcus uberis]
MKTEKDRKGVGYFDSIFAKVDIEIMAEALKDFALSYEVTEESSQGEVLNTFVSTLIKVIDLQNFKILAPQLFTYSKNYQEILEVSPLKVSHEELDYLQTHIDKLMKINILE